MSYEKVKQASKTIIRYKASSKSNTSWSVKELFVALDADNWVTDRAITFAKENGIPVVSCRLKKRTW